MTLRIGILVFEGFDLIDAGGPYEVFLTASRLRERAGHAPWCEVQMISPGGTDVTAFGGMVLTGLMDVTEATDLDVVVVPGTIDVDRAVGDSAIMQAVKDVTSDGALVTSVCTGSFLLARAGLLADRPATTHWEDVASLADEPVKDAVSDVRWVDAGEVVTAGGLTSGMHMALHIVERLESRDLAIATARQLDLDWSPNPERAQP